MKFTLDSNIIFHLLNSDKGWVPTFLHDIERGICDFAVTSRIESDIPNDPLLSELKKLQELGIERIGTATLILVRIILLERK